MDDEDEVYEYDEDHEVYIMDDDAPRSKPIKLNVVVPLAATLDLVSDLFEALGTYFDTLSTILCSHFYYKDQQALVHEQMAREIETLTKE